MSHQDAFLGTFLSFKGERGDGKEREGIGWRGGALSHMNQLKRMSLLVWILFIYKGINAKKKHKG